MLRITSVIIGLAASHFVITKIIVALTMQMGMFTPDGSRIFGFIGHFLVWLTRCLYFPIISLSLYSRQWFPGNWIYIPMVANSLIWGIVIYGIFRSVHRRH